jgi:hypothetical protein
VNGICIAHAGAEAPFSYTSSKPVCLALREIAEVRPAVKGCRAFQARPTSPVSAKGGNH